MPDLNDSQITTVSNKIKEQGLKSFAFSNELLDHVCCRIEHLMESGSSFESALNQSACLYQKKEINKIRKNFAIILNYSSFINSFVIYLSLLFYFGSWLFGYGQVDWIGLVAFVLISALLFRYNLLFCTDNNHRFSKSLIALSSVGFVFFVTGYLKRFLWLNFGFSGQHVMPIMLFSWLIISITGFVYVKTMSPKKSNRLIYSITFMQVVLACMSISTFVFPVTMQYIPLYATIIIAINVVSFLLLYWLKSKGKSFIRLIIVSSSFMVFVYLPHKSIPDKNSNSTLPEVKSNKNVQLSKPTFYPNSNL
jgi:hypothetical protein